MANVLVIYGHPQTPKSFNFDLKEQLVQALSLKGHNVIVRDLYQINFNPLLSTNDLSNIHNNSFSKDIVQEQDYITKSNIIIFIYPIWWAGQPAIIKGYIDRVFSYGFAYVNKNGKITGLLTNKKVVILNSHGNGFNIYDTEGFYDAMRLVIDKGIFAFCGFDDIKHLFFDSMNIKTSDDKQKDIELAINEVLLEIEKGV